MTSPLQVLLLDADGVLQYLPPAWAEQVLGDPAWPGLDALQEVEAPFLRGERHDGFPEAVEQLLREHGCAVTPEEFFTPWSDITAEPRALELVRQVRSRGVRVYLATNQQAMRAAVMRERRLYDDHVDGGYYSFELGVTKPSWDYFDHIVRDLRVARDRVLFVDDTAVNVAGARAAGLRAAHKPYAEGVAGLERVLRWHGLL
ncbi:HAD-IA family hydrolase [Arsenicicoccus dermatophilus]|uniref:HAD-IA family hydrolase n=1 Tax=Arsenicicoccus dermatophilus TaxID=1076331 RepID=UPI003916F87D